MDRRGLILSLVVMALVALALPAWAADEKTHEGILVSTSSDKLVMTDNDGKNEHSHMISSTTKFTLDGKTAKLSDLKKGHYLKVTTSKSADGKESVTVVAARTSK